MTRDDAVAVRQSAEKAKLIEQFRTVPIIQIACVRASVSRATYYRWMEDDPQFRERANTALAEGEEYICDKSEAQIISLIGEKHFGAIKHWLEHHHSDYAKGRGGRPDRQIRVILLHDHED